MKLCYIVYREDNVMVFDSQVLEYLRNIKDRVESIELILFRHEKNLFKKEQVEEKIKSYVDNYRTFASLPILLNIQLKIDALRLKKYVKHRYEDNDQVAVICRGDLASYIGIKAFKGIPNSRVLYDNRGLPLEESIMSHGDQFIHRINRRVKKFAIDFSKSHCDMYNFVTNKLRDYNITTYGYDEQLPYTIIPTLYRAEEIDSETLNGIREAEHCVENDFVVSYVGSTAVWQSSEKLIEIIKKIYDKKSDTRFFVLTNGQFNQINNLPEELQKNITVKSVSHAMVKYYLAMSKVGIVLRDDNIVNQVAAPTKIAEYITSGIKILYSGEIGILEDIREYEHSGKIIDMDKESDWIETLEQVEDRIVSPEIFDYFDMTSRQDDTLLASGEISHIKSL